MKIYHMMGAVLLLTSVVFGKVESTPQAKQAREVWTAEFHNKPVTSVFDERLLIDMSLFSGQDGIGAAPRSIAIADVMCRQTGSAALRGAIGPTGFYRRADELKGRPVTEDDRKKLEKLAEGAVQSYYAWRPKGFRGQGIPMHATFGLASAVSMHHTIKNARTVEDAFAKIARGQGSVCDLRKSDDLTLAEIQEAIRRNIPLLMQKDKGWFVCFGTYNKAGKTYLMLNHPLNTSLTSRPPRRSKRDRESMDPRVIGIHKARQSDPRLQKMAKDISSDTSNQIPPAGFVFEAYEKGKYTIWIAENWRYAAEAWDKEIREALKLPKSAGAKGAPKPLPDEYADGDLWRHYIAGRRQRVGGPWGLVDSIIIPTGRFNTQKAALFSTIATQKGSAVGNFAFSIRKLYRQACIICGDDFLIPTKEKRAKLDTLLATLQAQYDKTLKTVEPDAEEIPDPYYAAALRLSETASNTTNLKVMLDNIAKIHGWGADIETKPNPPFITYQAAIQKRIPILLQDNASKAWAVCVGYLTHNEKPMLLVANPGSITRRVMRIDTKRTFPVRGVHFEQFDAKKYSPYFIHNWRISAEPYTKEIKDIFPQEKN